MSETGPVPAPGAGLSFFRRRSVRVALGVAVLLVAGAIWAITALQKFVAFPGAHPSVQQLSALSAAHGEAHWLDVDGDRVEAWFLPSNSNGSAPLLIHGHGNGELIDIQTKSVEALRAAGIGVLLVEYPGYGRSEGEPSEESVTATFVAAYDWAKQDARVDASRVIGYGRSLGGGAVAQLAARRPVAALVLESTYTSIGELVRAEGIPGWLVVNEFDTRAVLAKYPGPVLILHGTQDGTFPSSLAEALHKSSPRSELHLEPCGHNDCPLQWELVLSFLARNGVFNVSPTGVSP